MEYFWDTSETIPKGVGFAHFSTGHMIWVAVSVIVTVLCCLHYRRLSPRGRDVWRKAVAVLLIADELLKQIPLWTCGTFILEYLPFHLCSINIFFIVFHVIKPNKTVGNFLYAICIPGAIAALLFPSWNKLPVMNFMYIHSFTLHILLIVYPAALVAGGDIKPRLKDLPKAMAMLLFMAVALYFFNNAFDTNFFFLRTVGKSNPLYWFKANWGNHLLGLPPIIAAVIVVMYTPIELYHSFKKK